MRSPTGLRIELAERRIGVLNVCPCYVETPFQQNVLQGRVPANLAGDRMFKVTAEECAEAVVNGLRNGKRTIVVPRIGWLLVLAARLFPATVHGRMAPVQTPARGLSHHKTSADSAPDIRGKRCASN